MNQEGLSDADCGLHVGVISVDQLIVVVFSCFGECGGVELFSYFSLV